MFQTLSLSLLIITTATEAYSFVPRTSSRQGSILEHVRVLPSVNRKHNYSRNKEGLLEMKGLSKKKRAIQASLQKKLELEGSTDGTAVDLANTENLKRKVRAKRPLLGHIVGKKDGGSSGPTLRPQGKARDSGMNNPSNLRIIGGSARGRRLDSPDVFLRPMMGKVREAVYSCFTSFGLYEKDGIPTRHLDIFSGSGSVGLESLSRGADHCTFVDLSRDCCDACERNIRWCEFDDARVVCADAIKALKEPTSVGIPEGTTYNIVTLCPPYEEVVYGELMDAVANSPLVTEDTVILVEYPIELGCMPPVLDRADGGKLAGCRNRRYGRTVIAMYVVNPSGRLDVAYSRPEEFIML